MQTKEFIGKFNEEEVIQKMQCVKTPEEAYAVAKEYGVTDSMEEFVEEMTKFKAAIDELSEEDLEAVAGGLSPEAILSLATATAASAVSAVSAVSATAVSASVAIASAAASGLVSASAGTAASLVSAATGASVGVSILGASAAAAV